MAEKTDYRGKMLELAEMVEYSDGSVVSKTLLDKKTGTLTLFAFDAGQGLSEHVSPYDATVLVTDGTAVLEIGGKPVSVAAGQMAIMVSHRAGVRRGDHGMDCKNRGRRLDEPG